MTGKTAFQQVSATGIDLIRDPLLNKGTAFTHREREEFGLHGLLPSAVLDIDLQAQKIYTSIHAENTAMEKYLGMMALQDRNEQLFYRVLVGHLKEFMPIVYTPTVAQATSNFSQVFRRARGVWITPDFCGHIKDVLGAAVGDREIRLIVVTDNESILGIGDQGAGGMAISIGKLALYTAGAGIHPTYTLPISLDVGTNNERLLRDDLYVGWREPRLRGTEYDGLVEEFVTACRELFPGVLIQWEDFRKDNALNILERYRYDFPSFNDDIQGTGAVALAGLMTAMRITGQSLADQRIAILGAGAAGLGIARQIRAGLAHSSAEREGLPMMGVLDSRGLLVDDREIRDTYKRELAWEVAAAQHYGFPAEGARDLAAVVKHFRPTVLIGSSGQGGAFSEAIVREMASYCERPIVLPFSNPDTHAEAMPADLYQWTEGRVLVATGSPFARVEYSGQKYPIGQGNNVFIFPGLGLGTLLCGAGRISNAMITAAAEALAGAVNAAELEAGMLFPGIGRLREVTVAVTRAVILQARDEGLAQKAIDDNVDALIEEAVWWPEYREYRRV